MSAGKIIGWSLVAILTSVAVYVGIGAYKMKNLCFKLIGFKSLGIFKNGVETINPFGADSYDFQLSLKLRNPSYLDVAITGFDLNVTINGNRLAHISGTTLLMANKKILTAGTLLLPKNNAHVTIIIPISIDLKDSSNLIRNQSLLTAFANKQYQNVLITIAGNFSGQLLKLPVSHSISITKSLSDIQALMSAPSDPNPDSCD